MAAEISSPPPRRSLIIWWDGKIQRTFRFRLPQTPGSLGRLLAGLGDRGGLTGYFD